MSDVNPEQYGEFVTQDGPGSEDVNDTPAERERPEEKAHGGSMAPGMVDDTGGRTLSPPERTVDLPGAAAEE